MQVVSDRCVDRPATCGGRRSLAWVYIGRPRGADIARATAALGAENVGHVI